MQPWVLRMSIEPAERIQQRIQGILEARMAIRFSEMCERLRMTADDLRPQLEAMRRRGEIQRRRPVGRQSDDLDVILAPTVPWHSRAASAVRG